MSVSNRNLLEVLNDLFDRPSPEQTGKAGRPAQSGQAQISANANECIGNATTLPNSAAAEFDLGPCLLSNSSRDGRGRPQKSVRVTEASVAKKINFR